MNIPELINNLTFEFPYSVEEWFSNPVMENFHYHTHLSNIMTADSPTSNADYAKKIKEYGAKCMFSGEHGYQGNQFEVHTICQANDLKYRHSAEVYWVKDRHENDNANCHMCIVATCDEGRKDLNYILSIANIDGYYYKPRIDLELLLSVNPNNFIVTSACVAGWKYEDADEIWLKIAKHFGDNFFFEVQPHNTNDQKRINEHILKLARENNIQIICGLDSHYINYDEDNRKRDALLEEQGIHYEDEDGWFLDYPSPKEVYNRFKEQGVLTDDEIFLAMLNTNVFNSNKVSECIFSKEFKIPNLHHDMSYDERCKYYLDTLYKEYEVKEKNKSQEKLDAIKYESEQFIESKTVDYPLITKAIIDEAVNNCGGVLTTTSRGSMSSFYTNYLIGMTTLDRFTSSVPIFPERFLTKDRVLSGQMPDCDLNISEQEPFVQATRNLLGEHGCYPLMAIGYYKEKSAWKMYARLNNVDVDSSDKISKALDVYAKALSFASDGEEIDIKDYVPTEYFDLYEKSKEYRGICNKLLKHACGHLIFDGDIRREIGLVSAISATTGKRTIVACAEGKYLDDYGYVKEDFLIVDSVTLIKKFWDSIEQPVPTFNELREMVLGDQPTWDIYAKGITCCINQIEREGTKNKAMKYQPQTFGELSSFISAIRPGFRTLVDKFLSREDYSTGEEKIDSILEDSAHWMLFQESIMKVLNYCGLPMDETYGVIKSISKKKYKAHPEKLVELKNTLTEGWVSKIGNADNFENVWNVIESAAAYCYNSPHAESMAGDSLYQAWFKAHYTSKFYEVAINHYMLKDNKDKVQALIDEATYYFGYKICPCKFREDNRSVKVNDETKTISKTFSSIKGMQAIAPDYLYNLGLYATDETTLFQIFKALKDGELNKKSIDIIFKLNYFADYGDVNYILQQWEVYNKTCEILSTLREAKVLTKKKCEDFGLDLNVVASCCRKETEKQFREIDNDKLISTIGYQSIVKNLEKEFSYCPITITERMAYELGYNGNTNLVDNEMDKCYYIVASVDITKWGTPYATIVRNLDGEILKFKVNKNEYNDYKFEQGDILSCVITEREKRAKNELGKWVVTGEYEKVLTDWAIIKRF